MSYYTNRRYNPPADVYRASTLVGQHTGKNAWTPLAQNPALDGDLQQFRSGRSTSPAADAVREWNTPAGYTTGLYTREQVEEYRRQLLDAVAQELRRACAYEDWSEEGRDFADRLSPSA